MAVKLCEKAKDIDELGRELGIGNVELWGALLEAEIGLRRAVILLQQGMIDDKLRQNQT